MMMPSAPVNSNFMYAAQQHTSERIKRPGTAISGRCYICRETAKARATGKYRNEAFMVCLRCVMRYVDPVNQIERYGRRFRFVERGEIPHQDIFRINESVGFAPYHPFQQIYKILLLMAERSAGQEILSEEVRRMVVDEKAEKILKLPGRMADILTGTFAVRGDDFLIPDDIAIAKIKDLIDDIDPEIMTKAIRKKHKRRA